MNGLKNSTIQIGTFTSVSRNLLLPLMKNFKCLYPEVNYILKQGDYSSIEKWIQEGIIDFGFVNSDVIHVLNRMNYIKMKCSQYYLQIIHSLIRKLYL